MLTKNSVASIASHTSHPTRTEELLRLLHKAGIGMCKCADLALVANHIFDEFSASRDCQTIPRWGGVFKRFSCSFDSTQYEEREEDDDDDYCAGGNTGQRRTNGGVWAGTEAGNENEKEVVPLSGQTQKQKKIPVVADNVNEGERNPEQRKVRAFTVADEHIMHCLECLAMG